MKNKDMNLKKALLSLRLGVFIVMFMWTIDKFINPEHAKNVYAKFYLFEGLSVNLSYIFGTIQLVLVIGFCLAAKIL